MAHWMANYSVLRIILGISIFISSISEGKLILKYYPKQSKLLTIRNTGRSVLMCEVESDKPFKLEWFKDGKLINLSKDRPPWPYPFPDKTGLSLIQWPYINGASRGTYKCVATNGHDTSVSHEVEYTPVDGNKLPSGFPVITKNMPPYDQFAKQYVGTNITLNCAGSGHGKVEVRWLMDFKPFEKIKTSWKEGEGFDYLLKNNNTTLKIYNLRLVKRSFIVCFIHNDIGIREVGRFHIHGVPAPIQLVKPRITQRPQNVSVQGPEQWIEFTCLATGNPQPDYSWWHDDRWILRQSTSGKMSLVAMRSGFVRCHAQNEAGSDTATAYIYVKPLPYKPNQIENVNTGRTQITIKLMPNYREAQWHANIPITYAILHVRPWKKNLRPNDPYNTTRISISGSPPWFYQFKDLKPYTWLNFRVRFGNRYGVGNVSDWGYAYSDWGEITEPVRYLKNIAHSNKSFTMSWLNPVRTYGPVQGYRLYWTRRPNEVLSRWELVQVSPNEQYYNLSWHGSTYITDTAPVIYWKVQIVGFVNAGPMSEVKVFRVSPGAPGFVTNVSAKTNSSRSIIVYWNATKEPGNGIVGHRVLYNRKDEPAREKYWSSKDIWNATLYQTALEGLNPNREYEVRVYPRSYAMYGVVSNTATAKTLPDAPTSPPRKVRAFAMSSETVQVTWEPPLLEHQNSPILKYKIFYTRQLSRTPYTAIVDNAILKYQLQGLSKFTKYIIWATAINKIGESPPSKKFELWTKEDAPQGAPRAVRAQALNDSAIAVTWLSEVSLTSLGRVIGYRIHYSTKSGWKSSVKEVIGANVRDGIVQEDVTSNTNYTVQVSAYSSLGEGPKSKAFFVITPPKLPDSPQVTVTVDQTTNYVVLKWWPRTKNVKYYKIEYEKTLRKYNMLTSIRTKLVSGEIRSSVYDDLDPGVYYAFKISAELSEGGWSAKHITWIRTSPSIPSGPPLHFEGVTESSSSIKLKWEEPDPWKRNGDIIAYNINYKTTKQTRWTNKRYDVVNDEDTIVFLLTDLKANARYQIKVGAITAVGTGPYTVPLEVMTNKEVLPMVKNLRVNEVSEQSVYLQWDEPINANKFKGFQRKYLITHRANKTYRNEEGKIQLKKISKTDKIGDTKKYFLDGLLPNTEYIVHVQVSLKDAGDGDPVAIRFTTKLKKPAALSSPSLGELNKQVNYLLLDIKAASEVNGPISYYLLYVIDLGDKEKIPSSYKPESIGIEDNHVTRRRRNTENHHAVDFYIAALFRREELPTKFKLGTGSQHGDFGNTELKAGHFYTTFVRAYVKKDSNSNQYSFTNSPFSTPVKYEAVAADEEKSNNMVIIIAGAASAVFILIVVLVIFFVCRRNSSTKNGESEYLVRKKKRHSQSADPAEVHRMQCATPGMVSHPPIPVNTLGKHVENLKANGGVKFLQEFESIDPGSRPSSEASLLPQNKTKNRYPNVLAFDESRVKLDHTGELCSDYINANYIDGYCKEKAYIASQGPMKNTVDDFWRLCWEQNVQIIVMMTKLEERGRNKCERYWPTSGVETYGTIKVEIKDETNLCHYCIRTFEISSTISGDAQTVMHYQYLQWPDPGVPSNPGPVLAFIKRVRAFDPPGSGPTLVHCSAGVGRSACYIAIDAMLERVKRDSMIDIYGYVTMMRTQRNFMVQTDEQYMFVYEVLAESIESGDTEIASSDLTSEFKKLTELRSDGRETLLEGQFKSISLEINNVLDPGLMTAALNSINEKKNRCRTVVPFDSNRVVLQSLRSHEGSDYINASFIDGYHQKNEFIATQGPLERTVADFWRMVMDHNSSIVVMLGDTEDKGKELCYPYWPVTKSMTHHYYVIDPVQENRFANFIVREFKITDARDTSTRHLRQYQYTNWQSSRTPTSSEGLIELIGHVQKARKKAENDGPVIVHGSTGAGRTGVFIGLSIALESLRTERIVDIYQIVKALRYQRPYMVQTPEQYEFCYQVTCDFLKNFDFIV
ncbi:receptor-type tyrosine-protein phosphatase delta-like [Hydractinia symbiolongicarpus]|uniref:receptor-type tyrosine-protein phosphatase delta-like n=1 Tax=Hydractinia symbiolongicarpus TaxID=13093 RepID=UPI00254A543E|nr:receptor-type tyrosine-protein phosphatase delta-like [Hydractinia symbiolongicarpus]XP_057298443.1 receptor-type tyrosine-protein phosphatase delta-like [Hydractinia symbiolongicarpus]